MGILRRTPQKVVIVTNSSAAVLFGPGTALQAGFFAVVVR